MDVRKILEYKSKSHKKLIKHLKSKILMSDTALSKYFDFWQDADDRCRFYTQPDEITAKVENKIEVVIPMSFLAVMVKLGILQSIFFSNRPAFQIDGRKPEDVRPAKLMESLIDYQITRPENRGYYNFYIWFQDALKYGCGINYLYWAEDEGKVVTKKELKTPFGFNIQFPKTVERMKTYEGNRMENIDPYGFLPDPRVSLKDFQKGEFCGRRGIAFKHEIRQRERDGEYFNTEFVKPIIEYYHTVPKERPIRTGGSHPDVFQNEASGLLGTETRGDYVGYADMYIKIIPSDYGLGDGDDLEVWHFVKTDNDVIINAEPHTFDTFPFGILETFSDGYSLISPGEPAYLKEMEDFATWLITSRKENVKKAINDIFVYDPRMIDESTLGFNQPGLRIKINPAFAGRGIESAIKQFTVMDVTVQHLQDIKFLLSIFEMITGVSSVMLGSVTQTGRKSATEIRGATQLATMRVKTLSELYSAQGVIPLLKQMVMNNQALMSEETYVKIVGKLAANVLGQGVGSVIKVSPQEIIGNYDFPPIDGTLPLDRNSTAQILFQVFGLISQNQMLMQKYNIDEVFKDMLFYMGIKNIEDYQNQPQGMGMGEMGTMPMMPGMGEEGGMNMNMRLRAVPDNEVASEREKGNLVSLEDALGGGATY